MKMLQKNSTLDNVVRVCVHTCDFRECSGGEPLGAAADHMVGREYSQNDDGCVPENTESRRRMRWDDDEMRDAEAKEEEDGTDGGA
jgi:hypothetical protein